MGLIGVIIIVIVSLVALGFIGNYIWEYEVIQSLWKSGNIIGKFVICIISVVLLPILFVWFVEYGIYTIFLFIKNAIFPRAAGIYIEIPYTDEYKRKLCLAKIKHEIWGMAFSKEHRVIAFLCVSDYKKACKVIPNIHVISVSGYKLNKYLYKGDN